MLANGAAYALVGDDTQLERQSVLLNQVVAAYEGRGEMYRVAHTDVERFAGRAWTAGRAGRLSRFRPEEIERIALDGHKLPMGVTRHIIPGRVLRINIPLGMLVRDEPLDAKNAWLDQWMKEKMVERHVRYYQEPVFLFDE